jgi:transcriptional regulator with XRE-family HTH domain
MSASMLPWSAYVARNVRAERGRQHFTQAQLAARVMELSADLGIVVSPAWTNSTVSEIESGARQLRLDDLPLLCVALKVDLLELSKGTERKHLAALGL